MYDPFRRRSYRQQTPRYWPLSTVSRWRVHRSDFGNTVLSKAQAEEKHDFEFLGIVPNTHDAAIVFEGEQMEVGLERTPQGTLFVRIPPPGDELCVQLDE